MKRAQLIEFVKTHPTYGQSSRNDDRGFERNVKLHRLNIPEDDKATAYEMVGADWIYDELSAVFFDPFQARHPGYIVSFVGRMSGHLVLTHKNGLDHCDEWSYRDLSNLVTVVKAFDKMVDEAVAWFLDIAHNNAFNEEEILVKRTVRVLSPKKQPA